MKEPGFQTDVETTPSWVLDGEGNYAMNVNQALKKTFYQCQMDV